MININRVGLGKVSRNVTDAYSDKVSFINKADNLSVHYILGGIVTITDIFQ